MVIYFAGMIASLFITEGTVTIPRLAKGECAIQQLPRFYDSYNFTKYRKLPKHISSVVNEISFILSITATTVANYIKNW
jgi:hypothetical protein